MRGESEGETRVVSAADGLWTAGRDLGSCTPV